MSKRTKFPDGWDASRVKRVLEHYEGQSEEQAVAEDEVAFEQRDQTLMEVPKRIGAHRPGTDREASKSFIAVARLAPNKQFEPTVTRRHVLAASAPLHYALAARWTAQRAAAQPRR
jgi:hypothetical protein